MILSKSIKICVQNGDRLVEDSECLYDCERYPSSYGLAKLAQEEFAKGFILRLIESGALMWTKEIRRSLNHHISKQLMTVIIDYLNPDFDEFMKMIEKKTLSVRPRKVSDAMNIYIHEVLSRWESSNWVWAEEPQYDKEAKQIFDGKEDKLKQRTFYVKISKNGQATNSLSGFNTKMCKREIEKAKRYSSFLKYRENDLRYDEIVEILKTLRK